ncbi:helicase-related protein, partial [Stenotrophomonas pictorum]|uniref:helicase-related protein n=1 Tax=Stenotrophomonas pictorum TaxID=86184 RepID=UPI000A5F795E
AARAVAARVAEELGTELGSVVGYQVRFTDKVGEDSRIKFMTDGILLAEIASDRWLSRYDTLIIDEAHERSLNIDFLLGYLKQLLRKRPDLKLIVTSATIDTERFSRHFDDAPVVSVEGRTYPVEVRYRPLEGGAREDDAADGDSDGERSVNQAIVAAIDEITRADPRGDVLVFLPGEREIRDAHQALERRKYRETEVLPLYARLSAKDQDRVFNPGPKRRLVLTTNVAETSLTVPRIRYVVDPATPASNATARGRSWTGCISSRFRRPVPTSARAAAGVFLKVSATGCMPRPTSRRARSSPIRKSAARRWPG